MKIPVCGRPASRILLPAMAAVLLSACGGGGGGSGTGTTPSSGYTVSGTIIAATGSAADSDINDPLAPYQSNDTISTPQEIANPAIVGGYANQAGTGNAGRSRSIGDPSDIYRVALTANQQITLVIADISNTNDLDLILGDEYGNLIASSQSIGNTETITAPANGTYLIEVYAYSGASNYVLTVGQGAFTPNDSLSVLEDFVPGEVVARMAGSQGKSIAGSTIGTQAGSMDVAALAGQPGREQLLSLAASSQQASAVQTTTATAAQPSVLLGKAQIDPAKLATIDAIKALRHRTDIEYAGTNRILHSMLTPNDGGYPLQWHYPLINLPQAWDVTTGSTGVVVAVIDTGVILAHPDLQGQLVGGYDFIANSSVSLDGDGIDNNPNDPGTSTSIFHGTHVAGTIGAATNNLTGVAGINWSVSLMPLRVLSDLGGTSYDVMQAVRYAAGLPNDSGTVPAKKADVINLSLGCTNPCTCLSSSLEQDIFTQARNQGVIVVAAAGNDSSSCPSYPAAYAGVISVSAVDINRNRAPYSNFGSTIDIAAPGGDLTQDINGDGYGDGVLSTAGTLSSGSVQPNYSFYQGTSMATPHVAGVAALMRSVNPALTPAAFDSLLASGQLTSDIGPSGRDDLYGYGLIDAHKAVVAAGGTPAAATLVATPGALNFGMIGNTLLLSLENGGGGSLVINTPASSASWLSLSPGNVQADGSGTWQVNVDRSGLSADTYAADITVTSTSNTVTIPVVMQVSNASRTANAGPQYVLLIDSASGNTVNQASINTSNGTYNFSFTNVQAGNFQVVSGSDNNNDGFICDVGESCGAYLTTTDPATISVANNLSLADFTTSYLAGYSGQSAGSGVPVQRYSRLDHGKQLAP